MSAHPEESAIQRFVDGVMGEREAVSIAEHVDSCTQCCNRMVALEPMSPIFASAMDPPVPVDLSQAVLAEFSNGPSLPISELAIGSLLLTGALFVALSFGGSHWFSSAAITVSAVSVALKSAIVTGSAWPLTITAATILTFFGLIGTARLAASNNRLDW